MASVAVEIQDQDEAELVIQMARNIRSLGQLRGLRDRGIAALIGMSPSKFSGRMSGETKWTALEIRLLSKKLGVSADAIYAANEATFRAALTAARSESLLYKCSTPSDQDVSSPVQLVSSRERPDGRMRRRSDRPLMNLATVGV